MERIALMLYLLLTIGTLVAVGVVAARKRRKALAKYWARTCTGRMWMQRFPAASKSDIRAFLDLLVDAFAFHRKRRLSFSPDDQVMDIYRAFIRRIQVCPTRWSLSICF